MSAEAAERLLVELLAANARLAELVEVLRRQGRAELWELLVAAGRGRVGAQAASDAT